MKKKDNRDVFGFDSYSVNSDSKEFKFRYKLSHGGSETLFEEVIQFPRDLKWNSVPGPALNSILEAIHLALGVSYWKTFCVKNILTPEYSLSKEEANFWNRFYTEGMGEFYYNNRIDFRGLVKFPFITKAIERKPLQNKTSKLKVKNRSLLFFGGGKDSWTSAELLRKSKKDFTFFAVVAGESKTIKSMVPRGSIIVERRVDPLLHEVSNFKGAYKGHVPISMIWALIGELAAILYGYKYVIASNEKSADYGNIKYLGLEVNHQWSKSLAAERGLQDYSKRFVTPDITYFSLLRSLYEFKIVEIFSRLGKRHFGSFTSCNRNFRMQEKGAESKWCRACPKCAFVFTMLAAFLPKKDLLRIFGENLFEKKELGPLFKELLGLRRFKPFECVGTPEEMVLALFIAYKSGEYKGSAIMNMFAKTILKKDYNILKIQKDLMKVYKAHLIPREFNGALKLMEKI